MGGSTARSASRYAGPYDGAHPKLSVHIGTFLQGGGGL